MARQLLVVVVAVLLAALQLAVDLAAGQPTPPTNFQVVAPRGMVIGRRDAAYTNCGKKKCMVRCDRRCPDQCFLLCPSCKTLCMCDFYPGISCGDPRFTGGDGNNFYFHGKKDRDFCIVTDAGVHVNAHFIGRRNPAMSRDFTWIQALGIRFADHRLYIGARKTAKWNSNVDRLEMSLDDEAIIVPAKLGARWSSSSSSTAEMVVPGRRLTVTRTAAANGVRVQLEGVLDIMANVVPVTAEDSRVHNYGVEEGDDDVLAHLDIGFKFHDLTDDVHGVLGQTYRPDYVNKLSVSASMPVMGGITRYVSSDIFAVDCEVARFDPHANAGIGISMVTAGSD